MITLGMIVTVLVTVMMTLQFINLLGVSHHCSQKMDLFSFHFFMYYENVSKLVCVCVGMYR